MSWDRDREQARQWLWKLEQMAGSTSSMGDVSPDVKLGAFATAAGAEALLLFADTLHEAMQTLEHDVLPELGRTFGRGETR